MKRFRIRPYVDKKKYKQWKKICPDGVSARIREVMEQDLENHLKENGL